MEGLIKRDEDLKIVPGLAERWESSIRSTGAFTCGEGVRFHDGSPFTADDVVFSAERARGPGSQIKARIPADAKVVKVDDHTVDFILATPNPILHYEWETWLIFSKSWTEANGAVNAQPASATSLSPGALKANGTGPFMITSHEPGVRTVFKRNPNWWGTTQHNLSEVVLQTVPADATRVAALLSGDLDLIDPVPVQDIERIQQSQIADVLVKPELRTIFLNMDSFRDELLYSNVKGKNPFKDARVRKAFYQAIDIETIKTKIMRGQSAADAADDRPAAVLARFAVPSLALRSCGRQAADGGGRLCPGLRARHGLPQRSLRQRRGDLPGGRRHAGPDRRQGHGSTALPKAKYFEKVGPKRYDSSFNLLGWTPSSLESYGVLTNIGALPRRRGPGRDLQLRRLLQSAHRRPARPHPGRGRHRQARRIDRRGLPPAARRRRHQFPCTSNRLPGEFPGRSTCVQRADNQIRFDKIWMQ